MQSALPCRLVVLPRADVPVIGVASLVARQGEE